MGKVRFASRSAVAIFVCLCVSLAAAPAAGAAPLHESVTTAIGIQTLALGQAGSTRAEVTFAGPQATAPTAGSGEEFSVASVSTPELPAGPAAGYVSASGLTVHAEFMNCKLKFVIFCPPFDWAWTYVDKAAVVGFVNPGVPGTCCVFQQIHTSTVRSECGTYGYGSAYGTATSSIGSVTTSPSLFPDIPGGTYPPNTEVLFPGGRMVINEQYRADPGTFGVNALHFYFDDSEVILGHSNCYWPAP